jgi:DNA-binding SARP family transcriptional activator
METMQGPARGTSSIVRVEVLLGSVSRDGLRIPLTPRELELVIALAVRKRCAPSELADMLWPDADGDRARMVLKVYVYRVRRRIGYDFIVSERGHYRLGPATIDVDAIETGVAGHGERRWHTDRDAALALTSRMFGAQPPETTCWAWFQPHAQRFNSLARDFAIGCARQAAADGDDAAALSIARRLTHADPCDEEASEIAIRILMQRGEHGAAFEEYRRCARAMRSEFDVEPCPRLRDYFELGASATTSRLA